MALSTWAGEFHTDFNTDLPDGASLFGGTRPGVGLPYPAVEDGVLKLTYALEHGEVGSLVLDELDADTVVGSFTAQFKLLIGGGNGAEGLSFNFASDLPDSPFGQEGAGTGLTVVFDTYDNGGNEAPAVDVKYGGAVVLHKRVSYGLLHANQFVNVVIQAKADGTLFVGYGSEVLYTNAFAFVPSKGRFGFGAATGGSHDNHWIDDLQISTTPLSTSYFQAVRPTGPNVEAAPTLHAELQNLGDSVVASSVHLRLDGVDTGAVASQQNGVTTVEYVPTSFFPPGSSHQFSVAYQDSAGMPHESFFDFTVADYLLIPGTTALAVNDVDTSLPGFEVRPVQVRSDANLLNSLAVTVAQLAGTLIDPGTGLPFVNMAVLGPNADGSYDEPATIQYDTRGTPFPGLPGTEGSTDFAAEEVTTYLSLDRGYHYFSVNSDDGFRVSAGTNPRDAFAQVLGEWDGTRDGGGDTAFSFVVEKTGIYPFRLIYQNGKGSGKLSWYSVNPDDGTKSLINDATDTAAVVAYRALKTPASLPAYALTVTPRPGEKNVSRRPTVQVVLVDDATQVKPETVQLSFDGSSVPATVSKVGKQTTVTFQPSLELGIETTHALTLVFSDDATPAHVRTQDWSFTTARSAQVTGQWDFDLGDLRSTIGKDLEFGDGPDGRMKDHTAFGTTTSFSIPDIDGRPAHVMQYTRDSFDGVSDHNPRGYLCQHGMNPNGGGTKVNQFTMIVDLMIPDLHAGDGYNTVVKWEAVDDFTIDGSISIQANNIGGPNTGGIGISGQYKGDGVTWIQGGAWQRVAVVVDMAAVIPSITYYIDGVRFGQMTHGDRWGFDQRHAIPPAVRLFGDGENDNEVNTFYVNSIQFRDGTLTDAEVAALGKASASGIPYPGMVGGQWDFNQGDLTATVGADMQYGDGADGRVKAHTAFGTTTSFGIPDIGGKPAAVMQYTRDTFEGVSDQNPRGYLTPHGLIPNAGGTKVNQFTLIVDLMIPDLHMGDAYNTVVKWEAVDDFTIDGSISIQANNIGGANTGGIGISGQYRGDGITWIQGGNWQRVAVVVDMAAAIPNITYYIDGVRFGQMTHGDRWGFDQRHAIPAVVRMFADGENDNEVNTFYVNSIQFRDGTISPEQALAIGPASAEGIPQAIPGDHTAAPVLQIVPTATGVRLTWDSAVTGYVLESSDALSGAAAWNPVQGVGGADHSADVGTSGKARYFRLRKQ